ncbi:hypothetical protein DSM100688_1897 [Bifidobacterium ramosum]|uniref:Uncharacterized protein n=1 Tax=Bifidobacterium ramosum TaxID=1798158 RepID=A0A6L4WY52_9BIFI|nr:hypothetical protein [Bifidobacterium ramosum]KAB8287122.1 hypothetical protein DSM100688_1897 [Bifidobacterium ramosum]NEG72723.1 hypothetical protein [Bifidobacterium ramosum]NEG72728.1 hypothetical protein [Bifidobacterium ramosum]
MRDAMRRYAYATVSALLTVAMVCGLTGVSLADEPTPADGTAAQSTQSVDSAAKTDNATAENSATPPRYRY